MNSYQESRNHSDAIEKAFDPSKAGTPSEPVFSALNLLKEASLSSKAKSSVDIKEFAYGGLILGGLSEPIDLNDASGNAVAGTFLSTLQHDFLDISGGKDTLTRADLMKASENAKDSLERAAALVAAEHFDALSGIAAQNDPDSGAVPKNPLEGALPMKADPTSETSQNHERLLSMADVNWASDMQNGQTFGSSVLDGNKDWQRDAGKYLAKYFGTTNVVTQSATDFLSPFVTPFYAVGESRRLGAISSQDQTEFASWMQP